MRFAVVQFGGSNCDRDTYHVLVDVCGVDTDLVWYKEGLTRSYDAVVLPGGFSYGDYLRAGAIAARTTIMSDVVRHAKSGGLVLGICNGAQIASEAGLVPGTFTLNAYPKFISRHVYSRFANPTLEKELEILRARNPGASSAQLALAIKLLDAVRGIAGMEDHPSIRESIDVAGAFVRDSVESLDHSSLSRFFCYFVKTGEARELLGLQLDYLLAMTDAFHPVIDTWLANRDMNWGIRWPQLVGTPE